MKKTAIIVSILFTSFAANAQDADAFSDNKTLLEIVSTCRLVITIAIYTIAVLAFVKMILEFSIKSKIVNKDIPETTLERLLPGKNIDKNSNLKWAALLTGAGIGFLLVYWLRPFGIHSLAILCLCLAAGYLTYHLFTRQNK